MNVSWKSLKSGTDIRGIAVATEKGAVTLTDDVVEAITSGYLLWLSDHVNKRVDELIIAGLSERSAIIINEYHELNKYLNVNKNDTVILSDFSIAGQYCCDHFGDNNVESLFVICMDNSSKIKGVRKISEGTEQKTENFPLEILRAAMVMRATNVILCHNHPSGNVKPSNDDIINTNKIAILLESAEIHLIDHIICSKDKFVSLAQRGILKN